MQPASLESIRDAVNSGEFERAQLLWNQCAAAMTEEVRGGRLSASRIAEVRELVEWSRVVVLSERAHMQYRLNRLVAELRVAGEYGLPVPEPPRRTVAASF
jgi:predicted protein tyrosine phosphatase